MRVRGVRRSWETLANRSRYLVLDPAVPAAKRKQIIKELRQLCIEELPEYVQPVGYKIIPEMPLTLAAKFDYRKLEEEITSRDY